ncbi:MAG: hypothetical protein RLZZ53_1265 [Acidobacteriota bacterium]
MTTDIKRILVPLDFSANSQRALEYARGLAVSFDAALHLVHVCEVPTVMTPSMDAYAIAYGDWTQKLAEEAERQLIETKRAISYGKVTTEVLFGRAAAAIVAAADADASDMIVMGTHGHGAVMHMIMGNVAERVVRTAPCPVLTVGQPRIKADKPAPVTVATSAAGFVALIAMAAMFLLTTLTAPAAAQEYKQVTPGAEVFRTYCASCHGTAARGDGPLASAMTRKPANLTEIAQRNGGTFPSELVFKTIDGRQPVRGHGGPDMPVWGDAFSRSREAGEAERVKAVIQSLVSYLDSIQVRPAHQQ